MAEVKFHVSKTNAIGETLVAEVALSESEAADKGRIIASLSPVIAVMDDRMLEMNLRVLGAQKIIRGLDPEVGRKVHEAIEMLYGLAPIPPDIQQSIIDQTRDSATFGTGRKLEVVPGGRDNKLDPGEGA